MSNISFDLNERNENLSSQDIQVLKKLLIQNKAFDPLIEDVLSIDCQQIFLLKELIVKHV